MGTIGEGDVGDRYRWSFDFLLSYREYVQCIFISTSMRLLVSSRIEDWLRDRRRCTESTSNYTGLGRLRPTGRFQLLTSSCSPCHENEGRAAALAYVVGNHPEKIAMHLLKLDSQSRGNQTTSASLPSSASHP